MGNPKSLDSVGNEILIAHYEYLATRPTKNEIMEYLTSKSILNDEDADIHSTHLVGIFSDTALLKRCLEYIAFKARIAPILKSKARKILNIRR